MKLFAIHTIHRTPKGAKPGDLPEVIEAGRVFDGTQAELNTFERLQRTGGAGATAAAREATPGEIADDKARQDIADGLDTDEDLEEGISTKVSTGSRSAKEMFEKKVADEKKGLQPASAGAPTVGSPGNPATVATAGPAVTPKGGKPSDEL